MDQKDTALEAIETARNTGKIKRGVNEVTKALERGVAKLVVLASDVSPPEVIMHIGPLAKEKEVPLVNLVNKEELGVAAGIGVPTSAVAVTEPGDAEKLIAQIGVPEEKPKEEKKPEKKEEKKEKPKEEKKQDKKEEKKEKPKEEKKPEKKEEKKEKPKEDKPEKKE